MAYSPFAVILLTFLLTLPITGFLIQWLVEAYVPDLYVDSIRNFLSFWRLIFVAVDIGLALTAVIAASSHEDWLRAVAVQIYTVWNSGWSLVFLCAFIINIGVILYAEVKMRSEIASKWKEESTVVQASFIGTGIVIMLYLVWNLASGIVQNISAISS